VKNIIYFSIAIIFAFASCKKSSTLEVKDYPNENGKVWNYNIEHQYYNFRPFQSGTTYHLDTMRGTGKVEAKGNVVLPNSQHASKFHAMEEHIITYFSDTYYQTRNDTMYRVAYNYNNGSFQLLPKNDYRYESVYYNQKFFSLFSLRNFIENGFIASKTISDSIIIERDTVISFVFPLRIGNEWIVRKYSTHDFPISKFTKKVISKESISISSKNYPVYKIQCYVYLKNSGIDKNLIMFEYVGEHGLFKREIIVKNIIVSDEHSPEGIGYVDGKEEYILTSFH